jgi:hypothetical protein
VPLATPGPRLTESQINGGSGNNPLGVGPQQPEDNDPDNSGDVMPVPDVSAKAPRMAPRRAPEDMVAQALTAWRQASDFCFAENSWTAPQQDSPPPAPVADDSGLDPSAAFIGLGVALGSYWGAPAKKEEERNRERFSR